MEEGRTNEDGNDGVDEGVGGDLGDGDVLDEVGVGGERDDRSKDREEDDGEDSATRPDGSAEASTGGGEGEVDDAGCANLPSGGDEGINAESESAREYRADGEGERGPQKKDESEEAALVCVTSMDGAEQGGPEEDEHSQCTEQGSEPTAQIEPLAAGQGCFQERNEDGDHGDDEGGVSGGDFGLGPDDEDVVAGHDENADERKLRRGAHGDAQAGTARQADGSDERCGDEGANGSDERRCKVLIGDANGAVGRPPAEVHAGEGEEDTAFLGVGKRHLFFKILGTWYWVR